MILRTDAVVLRTMEYGETSQIVTLFTREKGKLAVMAKGARLLTSRFGSSLQPMSYTQVVFYYKPTRSLQTLTESTHLHPFHGIGRDLEKLSVGQRIVELAYALLHDEQEHLEVFTLLVESLRRLDEATQNARNVWPFFQMRLGAALGFTPAIDRDAVAGLPDEGGVLTLDDGAVHPLHGAPHAGRRASRTALRAYAICARADLDAVMRMRLDDGVRREVLALIEAYLRFHVEEAYPVRSEHIIDQLLFHNDRPPPFSPPDA